MAGVSMNLLSKREFNFDSGSGTVTVLKAVDVTPYTEGVLLVRVHAADIAGSSSMQVRARTTAPSTEDPSVDFVYTTVSSSSPLTYSSA